MSNSSSFLTRSAQLIFSRLLQHHTSKLTVPKQRKLVLFDGHKRFVCEQANCGTWQCNTRELPSCLCFTPRARTHARTHTQCMQFRPVVIPISIRVTMMPLCCAISSVTPLPEVSETDCVFTNHPLTMETESVSECLQYWSAPSRLPAL